MNTSGKKTKYEKPEVRVIDLKAEEVLTSGCKLNAGPAGPNPGSPCSIPSACVDLTGS